MRRFIWWVFNNIPLGRLAPWVFGLAIGRRPRKIKSMQVGTADFDEYMRGE